MNDDDRIRILFVCMGNICRSPTAQGVAEVQARRRGWADRLSLDSAGTHAYHVGERPDRRACEAAAKRGIDLTTQRARRVDHRDYEAFDYILAMDEHNHQALVDGAPASCRATIEKMMRYSRLNVAEDVPDPYYGGRLGFEQVLDLLEDAVDGFYDVLAERHAELDRD